MLCSVSSFINPRAGAILRWNLPFEYSAIHISNFRCRIKAGGILCVRMMESRPAISKATMGRILKLAS